MRSHILGIGPIGLLLAHHLRTALPRTHSVSLIYKSISQVQTAVSLGGAVLVENQGIVETSHGYDMEVFEPGDCSSAGLPFVSIDDVKCYLPSLENSRTDLIEILFVTTKAHNTTDAISRLLHRLTPRSTIVLLQNGMGIYEDLAQKLFRNPESRPHFVLASNTHGAWLKSPLHVVHAGIGQIEFGIVPDTRGRDYEASLSKECQPQNRRELSLDDIARQGETSYAQYSTLRDTVAVLSALEGLGCKWKRMSDVQLAMRRKLVVNCVVNPLTAILGCRNGDLFKDEASQQMLHDVCTEAAAVFEAQLEADTQAFWGSLLLDVEKGPVLLGRMPQDLQADALTQEVRRVAQLTGGNISSTLSDIRKGRPTEISFLNGYLARLGKQYSVPTPVNSSLLNLVNMRSTIPIDQVL